MMLQAARWLVWTFSWLWHMEINTNRDYPPPTSPLLLVERAGAKQLMWLVEAEVCGRSFAIDRPVVSAKVQEIAPLALRLFPFQSVSSAALKAQGRQLSPHREDWLFPSVQCVSVCVSVWMPLVEVQTFFRMTLCSPNWQITLTSDRNSWQQRHK